MRLDELTGVKDILKTGQVSEILASRGFVQIGKGGYATVFSNPKFDYVLKVFASEDAAYRHFYNLVEHNPNIHFPKFIGKMIKITSDYYAIRMEKLNPIKDTNIIDYINIKLRRDYKNVPHENKIKAKGYEHKYPDLVEAIKILADDESNNSDTIEFDLHSDNVMQRPNGIPVIIDPYAAS